MALNVAAFLVEVNLSLLGRLIRDLYLNIQTYSIQAVNWFYEPRHLIDSFKEPNIDSKSIFSLRRTSFHASKHISEGSVFSKARIIQREAFKASGNLDPIWEKRLKYF